MMAGERLGANGRRSIAETAARGVPVCGSAAGTTPKGAPGATMVSVLAVCGVLAGCATSSGQHGALGADGIDPYERTMRMADSTRSGGDLVTAANLYQHAHALAPDRPEPLIAIGEISAALGSPEQASLAFARALAVAPDDSDVRRGYGKALLVLNSPPTATDQFRAAIRLDPTDARAYNGLGVTLDLMGRQDEAQQAYRDGLAQRPNDVALTNNFALSLAMAGRADEARALLQTIAAVPDAGPRVRQNLALVHALSGDMAAAAAVARQDLPEAQVQSNMAFYKGLGGLHGRELAEAVFRAQLGREKMFEPTATTAPPPPVLDDAYPRGSGQARVRPGRPDQEPSPALADAAEPRFRRLAAAVEAAQGPMLAGEDTDATSADPMCAVTRLPSASEIIGRGREARSPLEIVIERPARGQQRPNGERSLPSLARASLASLAATVGDGAAIVGRSLRTVVAMAMGTAGNDAPTGTELAAAGPITMRAVATPRPTTPAATVGATSHAAARSWPTVR